MKPMKRWGFTLPRELPCPLVLNLPAEGPRFPLGEVVSSRSHVQPMALVVNMEKEKSGAVYVRVWASHQLTRLVPEAPVLSG